MRSVIFGFVIAMLTIAVYAQTGSTRTGTFVGKSKHKASGTATLEHTDAGMVLVLGADFTFDGAPDPKLGFGHDGYRASTLFSALESNQGTQRYEVPENIDLKDVNEVWIWCEKFDVPLAVARLGASK